MNETIVNSNTCGYIKIDRMFISDLDELLREYMRIKEKIKKEIKDELTDDPAPASNATDLKGEIVS